MSKKMNITSGREYTSPTIVCEELSKCDVLLDSVFITDTDNKTVKSASYLGGYDLFDAIFD